MKFQEYHLYNSINDVYCCIESLNKKPRSADWLIFRDKRRELKQLIIENMADDVFYTEEQILKAWDDFGKNKEKNKLIIAVARKFGCSCFYEHRNRGPCSQIMSIERLPSTRSEPLSLESCVIVCKKHNSDNRVWEK